MTWAQTQRLAFIKTKIDAGEHVQRRHLREKFYITNATAATTFRAFEKLYGDLAIYDPFQKAYVRKDLVRTEPNDWRVRAESAEAQLVALTTARAEVAQLLAAVGEHITVRSDYLAQLTALQSAAARDKAEIERLRGALTHIADAQCRAVDMGTKCDPEMCWADDTRDIARAALADGGGE